MKKFLERECQETVLSVGSVPILFCLGIQPNCLNVLNLRVVFLRPCGPFRLRVRSGDTLPLPCGSIPWLRRHSCSETSSLTVIHSMSGNAWSYRRLVAYGFLGLSEGA